jgi:hypothetical protein
MLGAPAHGEEAAAYGAATLPRVAISDSERRRFHTLSQSAAFDRANAGSEQELSMKVIDIKSNYAFHGIDRRRYEGVNNENTRRGRGS